MRPPGDQFRCGAETGSAKHGLRSQIPLRGRPHRLGRSVATGDPGRFPWFASAVAAPALPAHSTWTARGACLGSESRLEPVRCATRSRSGFSALTISCQKLVAARRAINSSSASNPACALWSAVTRHRFPTKEFKQAGFLCKYTAPSGAYRSLLTMLRWIRAAPTLHIRKSQCNDQKMWVMTRG